VSVPSTRRFQQQLPVRNIRNFALAATVNVVVPDHVPSDDVRSVPVCTSNV
jgi:hypothetical protein